MNNGSSNNLPRYHPGSHQSHMLSIAGQGVCQ